MEIMNAPDSDANRIRGMVNGLNEEIRSFMLENVAYTRGLLS